MELNIPRLTVRHRLRLLWGKVRRLGLGVFRRRHVRESLARRRGECVRCGACCVLGIRCPSLRSNGRGTECRIHRLRPMNCRLFPIDERDLADRALIRPDVPCGFHFDGQQPEQGRGDDAEPPAEPTG